MARAIEENVLVQLENLKTHPAIADALSRNELTLHGWVYEFETGKVCGCQHPETHFKALDAEPIDSMT